MNHNYDLHSIERDVKPQINKYYLNNSSTYGNVERPLQYDLSD